VEQVKQPMPEWMRYAPADAVAAGYARVREYEPVAEGVPREPVGRPADDLDRTLLNRVQAGFPLEPRPFERLGADLGVPEAEVLDRYRRMRAGPEPVIRQTSAIFDTRGLGHDSSLVAFRIAEERLEEAARELNRCPGISHNYERNGPLNLWFTLAVPPDARFTLEETVERLARRVGAAQTALLPTLELYKIGVRLDVTGAGAPERRSAARREATAAPAPAAVPRGLPTARDVELIRALQEDLEPVERPFLAPAARLGLDEAEYLAEAERLLRERTMRRFAAVLRHQVAGFTANGMGVWNVPAERAAEVGATMASFEAVTHC